MSKENTFVGAEHKTTRKIYNRLHIYEILNVVSECSLYGALHTWIVDRYIGGSFGLRTISWPAKCAELLRYHLRAEISISQLGYLGNGTIESKRFSVPGLFSFTIANQPPTTHTTTMRVAQLHTIPYKNVENHRINIIKNYS